MALTGHDHSWQLFRGTDPDEMCALGGASFDHETGIYAIKSFGQDIRILLTEQKVVGSSPVSDYLLSATGHFFDLALLWYLMTPGEKVVSDELVRPSDLKGGQIFVTGTHVLPVEQIANKYASDPAGFIKRGKLLGGEVLKFGDAAVKLRPFPKLPVTMILWLGDDEFPPKVDFFFHQGCDEQLPTDVLWSTAMVTVLTMAADIDIT